jgi:hypothetical protein
MLDIGPDRLSYRCPVWRLSGWASRCDWPWWSLSVVEQRYRAVLADWPAVQVAAQLGVSRQPVLTPSCVGTETVAWSVW